MNSRFRLLAPLVATILAAALAGAHAAGDASGGDTKHAAKPAKTTKSADSKHGKSATKPTKSKTAKSHGKGKEKDKKTAAKPGTGKSHGGTPEPAKGPEKERSLASLTPGVIVPDVAAPSVSSEEAAKVREAFSLVRRGRTSDASELVHSLDDPVARKLVEWMILRNDENAAGFDHYAAFIRANPAWPNQPLLRRRAEGFLWHEHRDAATVRAFFANAKPASARGRFVLARALISQGDRAAGEALIREGWRNENFTDDLEAQVLEEFPHVLTRADHRARMQRRLYAKDFAGASRAAHRLGDAEIAIVKAYAAVASKSDKAGSLLDAVPAEGRQDAAYALARVQFLMHKDRIADAARAALAAPRDHGQVQDADEWWRTRRMLVRKLLDLGDAQTAYRLAREAPEPSGENYRADHHFTSGWLALRFLNDPTTALAHFQHIAVGLTNPIALARAAYWQARAAEALGRHREARAHYETAARYPTAYYGQLARAKLGITEITLRRPPDLDPAQRAAVANLEVVRAVEILYAIGERDLIISAVTDLAEHTQDIATLVGVAEITARHEDARATMLLGKHALARGLPFERYAFPNFGIPHYASVAPEIDRCIAYAIVRQESEFNQRDTSPAKAVGLMQVTPAAGKDTAKRYGVSYDWKRMVSDPVYNSQMGAAELSGLLQDYRGSYILTFAGYNAGRGRVQEWIQKHGDPRDSKVDPIDWVERIPFSETRNYVQRVMENFQIYRVRFGNGPRLTIEADLRRGSLGE
jgi:soluble lytic murein transglycosylase